MPNQMPAPRGKQLHDPDFDLLRMLDGHIVPDCETTMLNTDLANPHNPKEDVL